MDHSGLFAAITLAAAGLMAAILYGPWQTAWTDYFRQPLYEQRDALFELAEAYGIPFDDPTYVQSRQVINSIIRFAHRASLGRLIYFRRRLPLVTEPTTPWPEPDGAWGEAARVEHEAIVRRVNASIARMILIKSPLLCASLLLVLIPMGALAAGIGLKNLLRGPLNAIARAVSTDAMLSGRMQPDTSTIAGASAPHVA